MITSCFFLQIYNTVIFIYCIVKHSTCFQNIITLIEMNKTKQVAKCKNLLPFQRYLYVSGYVKKNTFKICPGKEIKVFISL